MADRKTGLIQTLIVGALLTLTGCAEEMACEPTTDFLAMEPTPSDAWYTRDANAMRNRCVAPRPLRQKPRLLWEREVFDPADRSDAGVVANEETLFAWSTRILQSGRPEVGTTWMSAIRLEDGRELWHRKWDGISGYSMTADEGALYLSAAEGVIAMNAETGQTQWQSDAPPGRSGWPLCPAVTARSVCVLTGDGDCLALDKRSGRLLWRKSIGTGDLDFFQITAYADRLVLAAYDRDYTDYEVVADPADGKVLGTWRLSRGSGPSRVISNGLLLVPASGEAAFTYPLDFAPRRAAIAAYDVRNGRRRWKLDLAKGGTVPGITTNGTDLFLSLGTMAKGSELARYELATGRQVWRRRLPEGTTDKSVRRADNIYHLIVSGSVLLGRVFDGELIAVDTKDGELLWTMPVRHHLLSDLMLAGRYLILVAGQSVQVYRTVDSSKDDRSSSTTWGSSNCPGILGTPITVTVKGIPASGVSSSSSSSSCACVQTPIRTDAAVQEKIHGTAHPIRPAAE